MRLFLTFCLGLGLALPGQAQERVRRVRVSVVDSSQLAIRYDLVSTRPGDSVYVQVRSRLRGVLSIRPEFVRGAIGKGIPAGPDRRIIWNALANGYSLNEEIQATVLLKTAPPVPPVQQTTPPQPTTVTRKVNTKSIPPLDSTSLKPIPDTTVARVAPRTSIPESVTQLVPDQPTVGQPIPIKTDTIRPAPTQPVVSVPAPQAPVQRSEPVAKPTEPTSATAPADSVSSRRKGRYAGPAWALLSAIAPGVGNMFVQLPKPKVGLRPLLTVGCYGLVVYGLLERQKSRDDYALYDVQKNAAAGEPYYQTANDHYHRYYLATRGAMVVAAADVLLTFVKGIRSSILLKEARRYQSLQLRPGLQAGQPTAVVRYSF